MNKRKKIEKLIKLQKVYALTMLLKDIQIKPKRLWSREWLLRRDSRMLGSCAFVEHELALEDFESFRNYVRMGKDEFELLHDLIESKIKKENTQFRQAISSRFRLIVTLRFLATGESYQSLSYSARISISCIARFIPEVCIAIYNSLKDEYLQVPSTEEEWFNVSQGFQTLWNIPNTIGALDGKHIVFRAPKSAGSHYFNYKGTHSIVLLALADANYKFLYIDVGTNGRISDGGVFQDCDFALALNQETLNLPDDQPLPTMMEPAVPFVILADAAFPLQKHIMKPYPFKNMSKEQRIFNYRLSRGRRVIENAFGILSNKFQVFLTPINLPRDTVVLITQTCCVLHNFLRARQETQGAEQIEEETSNLKGATFCRGRARNSILEIRETFKYYFNNIDILEWQSDMA